LQNLAGGFALAPFAFTLEGVREITPSWQLWIALAYLVFMVSVCACGADRRSRLCYRRSSSV
jgi:drug/metabolite transporter (DMT)-like permease